MSFKTKALGLAAAAALSLTMVGGAMAATGDTTVQVKDGAACSASITSGQFDFGTFTWNGTAYVNTTPGSGSLTVNVTDGKKNDTQCSVSLTVNEMTGVSVPANTIPASSIALSATGASGTNPFISSKPYGNFTVNATLTVPNTTVPEDTYQGTIVMGTQSGS